MYITSTDGGTSWAQTTIDDTQWLYETEFWVSMALVNGRPLIGWYRYDDQ